MEQTLSYHFLVAEEPFIHDQKKSRIGSEYALLHTNNSWFRVLHELSSVQAMENGLSQDQVTQLPLQSIVNHVAFTFRREGPLPEEIHIQQPRLGLFRFLENVFTKDKKVTFYIGEEQMSTHEDIQNGLPQLELEETEEAYSGFIFQLSTPEGTYPCFIFNKLIFDSERDTISMTKKALVAALLLKQNNITVLDAEGNPIDLNHVQL